MSAAAESDPPKNMAAPKSILFACNLNAVRSPMAAALARQLLGDAVVVDSVGVYNGDGVDPFAAEVMREVGLNIDSHASKTFNDVDPGGFEVIVALTPEAAQEAAKWKGEKGVTILTWNAPNPSETHGSRSQILDAFRGVRDQLGTHIKSEFVPPGASA